jgi:signal transduction histidine kinase
VGARGRIAHADLERENDGLRLLAAASKVLSQSLDLNVTLPQLMQMIVPLLGDWCVMDIVESDQSIRPLAVAHAERRQEPLIESLGKRFPHRNHVLNSCQPRLAEKTSIEELAAALALDGPGVLSSLDARSFLSLPIFHESRPFGVLTCVISAPGRHFDGIDLDLGKDLAERIATAAVHAETVSEAQRSMALRDDVMAAVSHDLRNPLSVILIYVDHLLRIAPSKQADEASRSQLVAIKRIVKRMDHMIQDLVDIGQLQAGELRIVRGEHELSEIMNEVFDLMNPSAVEKSLAFQLESPEIPILFSCDRKRVVQVLLSLLGKAIKLAPEGGAVTLRAEAIKDDVHFSVSGSGFGIREVPLATIFDRQTRRSPEVTSGGAGLGLFITKRLAEATGGKISATNQPGAGTTFHFSLPKRN